jgi:hypothetical protein
MGNIKLNIHTMVGNHTVKAITRANIVAINIVSKHMAKVIKTIAVTDQNVTTVRDMVITTNMSIINVATISMGMDMSITMITEGIAIAILTEGIAIVILAM